jgi:hypothetical protein
MCTRIILFNGLLLSFLYGCSSSSEEAGAVMKQDLSFAMADETQVAEAEITQDNQGRGYLF